MGRSRLITISLRTFLGKPKVKEPLNRLRRMLDYNIKRDLKDLKYEGIKFA